MSGVRGPTSALTEFLRERGITARNANRFRRRQEAEAEQAEAAAAAPPTQAEPSPRRRRVRAGASMNFDEDDDSGEGEAQAEEARDDCEPTEPVQTRSKRGAASAAAGPSNGKKPKFDDDADDVADAFGLPEASSSRSKHTYTNKAPGSIAYCGMCKAKFTTTRYTMSDKGPLCHRCKASTDKSDGAYKPPAAPRRKRAPTRRKPEDDQRNLSTLQSYCIDVISQYIEDIEALGEIGARNMDAISKAISKNRRLGPRTLQLFLAPQITQLSLYDCSKLDSASLQTLATFSPNIKQFNLQLCGQLDNAAIDAWSNKMLSLEKVELYGPYLVRIESWHRFFQTIGERLTSFKIRESPRFDLSCVEQMLAHCPKVTELGLAQIGPLDATMLGPLEQYKGLTYLDISDPGVSAPGIPPKSLEDTEVISLLKAVGKTLTYFDISKNADLTDRIVDEGILPNCRNLKTLKLSSLEKLTSSAISRLFSADKPDSGLTTLHLDRMTALTDEIIPPILSHSGLSMQNLNLNSVDHLTRQAFTKLKFPNLETLDVGFCRAVDDGVLEALCTNLPNLRTVWVFGCNRVSDFARSDRVRIVGKERYIG